MASGSVKSLLISLTNKFAISFLPRSSSSPQSVRPFESGLLLLAFPHVRIPAVPVEKSSMEEEVFLFAGNLEADVAEACPRNDGLLTFAARYCGPEFHRWPPNFDRPVFRAVRPTNFRVPYTLRVEKFVQMPCMQLTPRLSDSLRALISSALPTKAFLLIFAKKIVVNGIRHECLLALAARAFAVCSLPVLSLI